MDDDHHLRLLEEIRDLLRQQLENQALVIRTQQEAMARARRLLPAIGVVIGIILFIVLVLLRFVVRRYA
jgi:flagellar motor component MotA